MEAPVPRAAVGLGSLGTISAGTPRSEQGFESSQYSAPGKAFPVRFLNFLSDDFPFAEVLRVGFWDVDHAASPGVLQQLPAPPKREKLAVQIRLAALPNSAFCLFLSLTIF